MENNKQITDFDKIITDGERLIWSGKPNKTAYIFYKFLEMLPIALLWGTIDFGFIMVIIKSGQIKEMLWFLIPFLPFI